MHTFIRCLALTGILVGGLSANSVLSCSYNGGPFSTSGCQSLATFSFTESLDWANAYGSADTAVNPNTVFDTSNGPWNALTGNGITVGATLGPSYIGLQPTLQRVDNFQMVYKDGDWQFAPFAGYDTWNLYGGMFDAQTTPGALPLGDHLLFTNNGFGPLQLNFSTGINGALFRISTPTSGDTVATVAAYAVEHPTALDTPIMTYSIVATNASGPCLTLTNITPEPCNLAPYIGVTGGNGEIRSLVITSTDTAGLFIDTLYLDESIGAPEPGSLVSMSGAVALLGWLARRRRTRTA